MNDTPPANDPVDSLSQLPRDELRAYAEQLGLEAAPKAECGELLRLIRERQELITTLDRGLLLEICAWARIPVRASSEMEELVRLICKNHKMRFHGLSDRALLVLCRLRGATITPPAKREALMAALHDQESWGDYFRRKLRRSVGSLITQMITGDEDPADQKAPYQFLPDAPTEPATNYPRLKEQLEEDGIVGGISRRLRGVADDYVREKLDEIERRIDRKLDEIDKRMGEWRDREIRNRLTIIKVTLLASVVVALFSLGYDYLQSRMPPPSAAVSGSAAQPADQPSPDEDH
ncbi:MAG: hypothetical protein HJJLKODD_02845 [Phycisphaerae bacterium]|nr:hypothetical protein [Phycisphaerae bacterium]